ncbi:hypothetical protein EON65_12990 [archaeon]|nr:MAG: hypothetical protein EON65_12990 [archaeon]
MLKNSRTAIIIEDAHFCDELSWNELHLLLIGTNLNISVLLTMRSNSNAKGISAETGGNGFSDASPGPVGERRTGARKSVLISQSEATQAVSTHQTSTREAESDTASKYGLKLQTSAAFLSILGHEHSTVVEMSSLNETEVKDILMQTLKVNKIDPDMVRLVLDVSSGNAFWCKAIASFIKERGVQALEKAAEDGSRINSLKQLILLRMEKLDVDQQLVLKHASIIGDEFSEKMLEAVLPRHIRPKLAESTELLVEHGFVLCIQESPQLIFGFQNDLIRETVYELTPPRDAAHIHLAVAVFIEDEYAKNLRPFYPM